MPGSWGNRSADGKQRTSCLPPFSLKVMLTGPTIDIDVENDLSLRAARIRLRPAHKLIPNWANSS